MSARSEALKRKHDWNRVVRCCIAVTRNRKARKSLRLANRHQKRKINMAVIRWFNTLQDNAKNETDSPSPKDAQEGEG